MFHNRQTCLIFQFKTNPTECIYLLLSTNTMNTPFLTIQVPPFSLPISFPSSITPISTCQKLGRLVAVSSDTRPFNLDDLRFDHSHSFSFIDWALLSADLNFIYMDPVLASHLGEQADALVGKPLLMFVHPDEQDSAKIDLGSVLETKTMHGNVTR
jgi:hypothetical protein